MAIPYNPRDPRSRLEAAQFLSTMPGNPFYDRLHGPLDYDPAPPTLPLPNIEQEEARKAKLEKYQLPEACFFSGNKVMCRVVEDAPVYSTTDIEPNKNWKEYIIDHIHIDEVVTLGEITGEYTDTCYCRGWDTKVTTKRGFTGYVTSTSLGIDPYEFGDDENPADYKN